MFYTRNINMILNIVVKNVYKFENMYGKGKDGISLRMKISMN